MAAHTHHSGCSCQVNSALYSQTIDEMDFERGIWSAAMNGEIGRVKEYLDKHNCPNALDTAGYTALVIIFLFLNQGVSSTEYFFYCGGG